MNTLLWLKGQEPAHLLDAYCTAHHIRYQQLYGHAVGLAVLRIGDDAASMVYVGRKRSLARHLGFSFHEASFTQDTDPQVIARQIHLWNQDPHIHGIIVQLPVSAPHQARTYLTLVDVNKDVDGLHPSGGSPFTPCTPLGCLALLKYYKIPLKGTHSVVVGRSSLVGLPLSHLLLQANSTVTVAHSHTGNLPDYTRKADILCVCTGHPGLITPAHVSPRTVVVDIGIHRSQGKLVGDVDASVKDTVRALTPVPGGVGPMTVRLLMWNTLRAAFRLHKEEWSTHDLVALMGPPIS